MGRRLGGNGEKKKEGGKREETNEERQGWEKGEEMRKRKRGNQ